MFSPATRSTRLALLICFSILLAGCGHTDPDTRTSPAPGGSAGVSRANSGNGKSASGNEDFADEDNPSNGNDSSGDTQDDDSGADGQGDSGGEWTSRKVPDGTLTFTVILKADDIRKSRDEQEVATLQRSVQGRVRMQGIAGNHRGSQPAGPMDGIREAMDGCGSDMTCKQKMLMQKLQQQGDVAAIGQSAYEAHLRDTTWSGTSCSAHVKITDKATWSGATATGFRTGHAIRSGEDSVDCSHDFSVANEDGPRLDVFDASKTYDLTLPQLRLEATTTFVGGPTEPSEVPVILPGIIIKGAHYDSLDKPLDGSATVRIGAGRGLWNEHWEIPLTEEVSWTFTPDAK
ncbi:MAG: hypothetical protein ACTHMO_06310 [Rhodanobacteraceae bacterium]